MTGWARRAVSRAAGRGVRLAATAALVTSVGACVLAGSASAVTFGSVVYDRSASGSGAPPTTLGGYAMTPFGADPSPINSFDGPVPAPGGGTLTISPTMRHNNAAAWDNLPGETWGNPATNNYTGDVWSPQGGITTETLALPVGTRAFSFYLSAYDLNTIAAISVTDQYGDQFGPTNVSETSTGPQAIEFGFYATGVDTIQTLTITNKNLTTGFGLGELGINTGGTGGAGSSMTCTVSWNGHTRGQFTITGAMLVKLGVPANQVQATLGYLATLAKFVLAPWKVTCVVTNAGSQFGSNVASRAGSSSPAVSARAKIGSKRFDIQKAVRQYLRHRAARQGHRPVR
jgi:hypothetical protein